MDEDDIRNDVKEYFGDFCIGNTETRLHIISICGFVDARRSYYFGN